MQTEPTTRKLNSFWTKSSLATPPLEIHDRFAIAAESHSPFVTFTVENQKVQAIPIDSTNLCIFRELNSKLLPVCYNETFYRDIVKKHSPRYCRMGRLLFNSAFINGKAVAAITCRKERVLGVDRLYIMTLGVLPEYRRKGVGRDT
jgi:ribosomal protein S18 acetylase RimI-like enzyme